MAPIEFLTSAQELNQGHREIDYRNATSRAYYMVYHLCVNLLKSLAIEIPPAGSHDKIIRAFQTQHDKRLCALGNVLAQLRESRVLADYKLDKPFPASEARKVIAIAKKIPERIAAVQTSQK